MLSTRHENGCPLTILGKYELYHWDARWEVLYESLLLRELEEEVRSRPIAYLPLGSLEWHGQHLPVGTDGLKAYAICSRARRITGGVVLPPLYYGTECVRLRALGRIDGTIDVGLEEYLAFLGEIARKVSKQGFRVIVLFTGHYSREQVYAVKAVASRCEDITRSVQAKGTKPIKVLGIAEYELALDLGYRGDHAGKWETSIMMYLFPELVKLERLGDLLGIEHEDPRSAASRELGKRVVDAIVNRLAERISKALGELNEGWRGS